ncbi:PREDICTED: probable aquaporin SIP2-1 [Nelumbo nucifera]|uniref:Aquaporin SIP2-1 n=2 Tax=Nelumbo nucifera TaxID=4432 RepID=A0A822ZJB6_NELNU|nr:PREDICTED: probable aquaporin SIP2-1 [Nelumbo nucifera]DAD43106.1 TPA_asm: hypothetical protein HUJ06_001336 [Nelumbo nucifera]
MAGNQVIFSDFLMSFICVWSRTLSSLFVNNFLGFKSDPRGEIIKGILYVLRLFFYGWLSKILRGASYNPLTVLSQAISGKHSRLFFTLGARIPAQVMGAIIATNLILRIFPHIGYEPLLKVDMIRGVLIEGVLAFAVIVIRLEATQNHPNNFFLRTWIYSICRLALHILGSGLTGGCMNPISAIGRAYTRGDHITKELIFVYWLAPFEATVVGVWTFRLFIQIKEKKEDKLDRKIKSE